jgi:hypothetical protein
MASSQKVPRLKSKLFSEESDMNKLPFLLTFACSTLLAACGTSPLPLPLPSDASQRQTTLLTTQGCGSGRCYQECPACIAASDGNVATFWLQKPMDRIVKHLGEGPDAEFVAIEFQPSLSVGRVLEQGLSPDGNLELVHVTTGDPSSAYDSATQLPAACFQVNGSPRPDWIPAMSLSLSPFPTISQAWSSGAIKFTPPVSADQVTLTAQADQYCASNFGAGWRALRADETTDAGPAGTVLTDVWGEGIGDWEVTLIGGSAPSNATPDPTQAP